MVLFGPCRRILIREESWTAFFRFCSGSLSTDSVSQRCIDVLKTALNEWRTHKYKRTLTFLTKAIFAPLILIDFTYMELSWCCGYWFYVSGCGVIILTLAACWTTQGSHPAKGKRLFPLIQIVQIGPGTRSASCSIGTGIFSGGKAVVAWSFMSRLHLLWG